MKDETRITLLGRDPLSQAGAINSPVYHASTIVFPGLDAFEDQKAQPYTYGLDGTPGTYAFQDAMTQFENGTWTAIAPSGLGACTLALLSVLRAGDHLLMTDSVYEPTRVFCARMLKNLGVETTFYDPLIAGEITRLFKPTTRAIFLESPGSRTFEVQDVPAIVGAAKAADHEILTLMDNAWATPLYFKPLDFGVDLSIQPTTKYIAGHSDLLLGTVTANARTAERLKAARRDLGLNSPPDDVYLALRGLRTLAVRLKQHFESAKTLASWLATRVEVERVMYPALEADPGYAIWRRDFRGASGLFGCVLKPCTREQLKAFIEPMRLFKMGWSWGGFDSLITIGDPNNARSATRFEARGPVLRLQIGLEHVDDLKTDLEEAFRRLRNGTN